jgi:hypothetical protein
MSAKFLERVVDQLPRLLRGVGLIMACTAAMAQMTAPAPGALDHQGTAASMAPAAAHSANGFRGRPPAPVPTLDQIPVGTAAEIEEGRKIYLEGILPNGQPLTGRRLDGEINISGQNAACVLCHRRSGLGGIEGNNRVSPISGRYLFKQDTRAVIQMNVRTERGFNRKHDPYTLETLSAAIRGGIHVSGRELAPLMPRYALSDRDIRVLASYLRQLSAQSSPGVTETNIRYATVITPDVDPQRKQAFLATMRAIVHQRNGNVVRFGQRTVSSGAEQAFQTNRTWDLDVWELTGAADTWAEQLKQRYAAQPVFALLSGLGGTSWEPVHQFCESNLIPCWFPSIQQAPDAAEDGFYSIYFTRGVSLEADVLGRHLGEGAFKPARMLQVYSDAALDTSVVTPLKQTLDNYHISNDVLHWDGRNKAQLGKVLAGYGKSDAVVFWLAPKEIEMLNGLKVPAAQTYFSGQLARGEMVPLNAAWKQSVQLVYPYQLPDLRRKGLTYFHQWINERQLSLVDEQMQSEVYFALTYLVDTLVEMLDNVHRDFLLERAESNLSLREAANAENLTREVAAGRQHVVAPERAQPLREMVPRPIPRPLVTRDEMATGPMQQRIGQREEQSATPESKATFDTIALRNKSTTVYPRLSLAQFQRLASKGAYIVHFTDPNSNAIEANSSWIIP